MWDDFCFPRLLGSMWRELTVNNCSRLSLVKFICSGPRNFWIQIHTHTADGNTLTPICLYNTWNIFEPSNCDAGAKQREVWCLLQRSHTELYHHHPCLILIMTVFPVVRHIMLSWPISSLCPSQGWKYSLGCLPISTHYKSLLLQYFAASHLKLPNYCNIIYFVGTNTTFVLARS